MIKNKIKYMSLMIMLVFSILFLETKGIDKLIWKTIASTIFTTIGFIHYDNRNHSIWMLVGIFYSFVADVLLELNFIFGAIAFALAHVFFFISYSKIQKINKKDMIYGVSLFIFILTPLIIFINYILINSSTPAVAVKLFKRQLILYICTIFFINRVHRKTDGPCFVRIFHPAQLRPLLRRACKCP